MYLIVLKDYLFIILIFIVSVLLSLLITLFYYYTNYVKESSRQKKWIYDELNLSAKHNAVVFLGDSLTDFYRTSEFFLSFNIYNRGIAGDTTDDILKRIYTNVINIKPKKIFLQIGTNDLGFKKTPDYVIKNIEKILDVIQKELVNTKIYLISLYPVNPQAITISKLVVSGKRNTAIDYINKNLLEISQKRNITYIDINTLLKDEQGYLKKEYTVEGLHLSLVAYAKITEALEQYVYDSYVSID